MADKSKRIRFEDGIEDTVGELIEALKLFPASTKLLVVDRHVIVLLPTEAEYEAYDAAKAAQAASSK